MTTESFYRQIRSNPPLEEAEEFSRSIIEEIPNVR